MKNILLWTAAALAAIMASCTDLPIHDAIDKEPSIEPKGMVFVISGVDISARTVMCEWLAAPGSSSETKTAIWNKDGRVVFDITGGVVKTLYIRSNGSEPLGTTKTRRVDGNSYPIGRAPGTEVTLKLDADFNVVWRLDLNQKRLVGTVAELMKILAPAELEGSYMQEADIDFSGQANWQPIGGFESPFTGSYSGSDYRIDNLLVSRPSGNYVGLFGISTGSITDITLGGSGYVVGNVFVGGICGLQSGGDISGCRNLSESVSGAGTVGGICGKNEKGTLSRNSNESAVAGDSFVGGICGYSGSGSITGCENRGNMQIGLGSGGVCGYNDKGTVTLCKNYGHIGSYSDRGLIGGICGGNQGKVSECENNGVITTEANVIGGICGDNLGEIKSCTNNSSITGYDYVGGICGSADGPVADCINNESPISGHEYIGGIVGRCVSSVGKCNNTGKVEASGNSVGGIGGNTANGSSVSDCINSGGVSGWNNVGGISGTNNGALTDCSSLGKTVSGSDYIGGICGRNAEGTIESCRNDSSVAGARSGGICGVNTGTLQACNNTGGVSGNVIGGVCGENYSQALGCRNEGDLSGAVTGGVCGLNESGASLKACYNIGDVSSTNIAAGICGWNKDLVKACYSRGTVSGMIQSHYICPLNQRSIEYCFFDRGPGSNASDFCDKSFVDCGDFGSSQWTDCQNDNSKGWALYDDGSSSDGFWWNHLSVNGPQLWWEE